MRVGALSVKSMGGQSAFQNPVFPPGQKVML